MKGVQGALMAAGLTLGIVTSAAGAGLVETGPDLLSQTTSLGAIIAASKDEPVHILFVHGIRAGDRGSSDTFRANLCARLKDICLGAEPVRVERAHRLDVGPRPDLTYMGQTIWPNDAAWAAGPFVDRYEYARKGGGAAIVVDEVNWWPLALPLRCLALLQPEAELAGPDVDDLRVCAAVNKAGQPLDDGIHYPFLAKARLDSLIATKPLGGGAALGNGFVKRALMDWGLSDAVIALGPMQKYLREAIDQAFGYAADRDMRAGRPARYVVVSESLGSFIVFDAYAQRKASVRAVLDDTAYVYFFANQLALLELGRLSRPGEATPLSPTALEATPAPALSLHGAMTEWGGRGRRELVVGRPAYKQIIAFSDPSDALTFRVPPIDGVTVVNVYDRNGIDLLHLGADPVAAHTGHSSNPHVLDLMLQ